MAVRHVSTVLSGDTVTVDSVAVLISRWCSPRTFPLYASSYCVSGPNARHVMSKDFRGRDSIPPWIGHFSYGVFAATVS